MRSRQNDNEIAKVLAELKVKIAGADKVMEELILRLSAVYTKENPRFSITRFRQVIDEYRDIILQAELEDKYREYWDHLD